MDCVGLFTADLALSLELAYRLNEDLIFETYMNHLFAAGRCNVNIYATNGLIRDNAPYVTRRRFSSWVAANSPQWQLESVNKGPGSEPRRADFCLQTK